MTTPTTPAAPSGTVGAVIGRSGHCMDCANWTPKKPRGRDRATFGKCRVYDVGHSFTSCDSSCNLHFAPANNNSNTTQQERHKR